MLQYQLPSGVLKLSEVFERIENHLDILEIEDYSVSQTTLDNVSNKNPFSYPYVNPFLTDGRPLNILRILTPDYFPRFNAGLFYL